MSSQSMNLSDDLSDESMSESAKSIENADENQIGFIDTKHIVCNGYKRTVVMVPKCEGSDHTVQDIMEPLQVTAQILIIPELERLMGVKITVFNKSQTYESGIFFTIDQDRWKMTETVKEMRFLTTSTTAGQRKRKDAELIGRYSLHYLMEEHGFDHLIENCLQFEFIKDQPIIKLKNDDRYSCTSDSRHSYSITGG